MCTGEQFAWWLFAQDHALMEARQLQEECGIGLAMLKLLHAQWAWGARMRRGRDQTGDGVLTEPPCCFVTASYRLLVV